MFWTAGNYGNYLKKKRKQEKIKKKRKRETKKKKRSGLRAGNYKKTLAGNYKKTFRRLAPWSSRGGRHPAGDFEKTPQQLSKTY